MWHLLYFVDLFAGFQVHKFCNRVHESSVAHLEGQMSNSFLSSNYNGMWFLSVSGKLPGGRAPAERVSAVNYNATYFPSWLDVVHCMARTRASQVIFLSSKETLSFICIFVTASVSLWILSPFIGTSQERLHFQRSFLCLVPW